jgi:hypothetical protein
MKLQVITEEISGEMLLPGHIGFDYTTGTVSHETR